MEVVSVRIPRELKEEMNKLDLDWAAYLRAVIEEKVKTERMSRASTVMDELREKTKGVKFDSAKVIREARDSR
jgi:predicted DNA-binding protein